MQNFVELLKDHALILASINSLNDIAGKAEPRPDAAFATLRRLARLMDAHLRAEEEFIHRDHDLGDREFAALARQHDTRFEDMVGAWDHYLARWTQEAIHGDWAGFGRASRQILPRLADQVEAENQSLYPAALKYGLIRLLPGKAGPLPR